MYAFNLLVFAAPLVVLAEAEAMFAGAVAELVLAEVADEAST